MTPFQGNKGGGHSLWGGEFGGPGGVTGQAGPRGPPPQLHAGLVPGRAERLLGGQPDPPVPPCGGGGWRQGVKAAHLGSQRGWGVQSSGGGWLPGSTLDQLLAEVNTESQA